MRLLKSIRRTPLFRVTSLNSISVLFKIIAGLVSSKLMAIFVGPTGLALTGNLKNFLTSLEGIATLGIQNGIVKNISENKEKPEMLQKTIATFFWLLLLLSVVLGLVLVVFSAYFNELIFGKKHHFETLFVVLGALLPLYMVGLLLTLLLAGLGQFKRVIWVGILASGFGLIYTVWAVMALKTYGALISLVVPPAVLFVFAFYHINRVIEFKNYLSFHWVDLRLLKNMSSYALMTLVSAVGGSWVYLLIRQNLIHSSGIEQAGYWEAISRISSYYLLFISSVLSVYFFPKLSAATSHSATKNIFMSYFKGIMPLFLGGLFLIYVFRNLLVTLCFSTDFAAVHDLFFWQLLGDFFKAASLILGYQFLAKQLTRVYLLTEVFSLVLLASLSYYWAPIYGAKGVVMAYAADYFIYFLLLVFYFRKTLFSSRF